MWPNRRVTDLLKIEHPLISAPMAGVSTVRLAAAVCNAGALGSIACATVQPDDAARLIRQLRHKTQRPINVNFFCHRSAKEDAQRERAWSDSFVKYYRELGIDPEPTTARADLPRFDDAMCAVVEYERPEVVSFHFGLPDPALLARVQAAGCRVMSSATTVKEAIWLEALGVDVIIAQGCEAGGHRGMFLHTDLNAAAASQLGTMALVPQIVDAVSVPVIAAGGISDGRGIAASFALGAAGAQLGTAYLLCPEIALPSLQRHVLRSERAYETLLTNVFTGRPARALANRLALEAGPISNAAPDFPLPMEVLRPLRAKAEQQGIMDFTPIWLGQAAPLGREMAATALTIKLVEEAEQSFDQLSQCCPKG
jgi:nitronate monooxygenase